MDNREQAPEHNANPTWEGLEEVEPRFELQNRVAAKFNNPKNRPTLNRALKAALIAAGVTAAVFMSKGETPVSEQPTAITQEIDIIDHTEDGGSLDTIESLEDASLTPTPAQPPELPEPPSPELPGPTPPSPKDPDTLHGPEDNQSHSRNAEDPIMRHETEQLKDRLESISPNKLAPYGPEKYTLDGQYHYEVTRDGKVLTEDGIELDVDLGDHFQQLPEQHP